MATNYKLSSYQYMVLSNLARGGKIVHDLYYNSLHWIDYEGGDRRFNWRTFRAIDKPGVLKSRRIHESQTEYFIASESAEKILPF